MNGQAREPKQISAADLLVGGGEVGERIRQSEERFRMLADNMSQLAWTCDLLGNVTWYNKRWLDYTGLTFEDMKGWDWTKVQHPDHVDRVVARVQRSAETGEPWEDTFPLRGKDGTYRWFLSRALPIRDEQGKLVQWFGTNTDVTDQKLAEEQVARQAQELRALNERLRELDRAKTAFFSNVSHEFRTPLTLMLGPLEELQAQFGKTESRLTTPEFQQLTTMHRNGLRLLKLVNTLLDFSRIEAGRVEAVYEETDLAAFTAELASVFRSAIEKAGLKLTIDCPSLPEPVCVDRQMWEKIVFNLLSNAFKFTFEGEIEVALRWREEQVELSVRDTGVGIAADELPRIFERFHRVPNVRSRTYEGTGIGLALVQELARLHGGEATVQSTLGHGSTLTVTIKTGTTHLPKDRIGAARTMVSTSMSASSFVEEALRWLPSAEEGERGRNGEGEKDDLVSLSACLPVSHSRILVADDNADMREYVRRLLLRQGHDVVPVPDGEAALAVAREQKFDLVLADVMMPRLDGFGLLRALRDDPATSTLPIILLSARAGEESRVEGFERGADDYLVKPFSARELLARVGAQLMMSQFRAGALQRERILRFEAEKLNEVARSLTAELDLQTLVQKVTDAGTELTAARFGAFFYNSVNEQGESYLLYTLSGAPREAFEKFGIPRNTPLFQSTFRGAGVVRIDDVLKDPRYGHHPLHHGMPQGHLAVRSYLAVPVISRFDEVLGGLFFGHPEPAVFTEHAERVALGIAAQAAIAIDNAKLHGQARKEIEERVRIEEELKRFNEELERRVAQRTSELQQANVALLRDMEERKKLEEQLLQAQKMESIGVLAGGIAHDFNNILNIIQGYASLLSADRSQNKQTGESLTIINESIQRGSALVQQLLTLARKSSTQRESVNANALIDGLIALMNQTFPKTIELSASLEADLPPVAADKNQIEQALLNLCVNARDAMAGGGRLTLKTQSVEDATLQGLEESPKQRYVCIEVTDTGTGMDESVRERIFEPFFTTKDKSQGTGLGLSVVYGIVKNHNGVIDVESEPGRGTTFRLYFPVSPAAARPRIDRIAPVSPETRKESNRCGTILLVEDEKEMLYLMEKVLLRHGYRVLTAIDGEKALEVYRRNNGTIDAVLLDIGLPKIAGRDVLRQMQQQNPAVRVVIASGYLDPALKSEIYEVGVQHFVDKPYRLDQVVNTLQSLIERKS